MDDELVYWNFFLDFGPLNLGQLYRFCERMNDKLSNPTLRNHVLCYYSGAGGSQRANATYLICAWSMLYLGRTLMESYNGFEEEEEVVEMEVEVEVEMADGRVVGDGGRRAGRHTEGAGTNKSLPPWSKMPPPRSKRGRGTSLPGGQQQPSRTTLMPQSPFARLHPLPPYHDASPVACTYDLSVKDCLMGLDKARRFGFFKFGDATPSPPPSSSSPSSYMMADGCPASFDVDEYEHFEQVENGDLNWIIAGRILAFAGPQSKRLTTSDGYCVLTPDEYIPYFRQRNVELVIQLNKGCYDGMRFANAGIRHVTHTYPDGSCPELGILHEVLSDMEGVNRNMAFAVHCKAGLGRTGTCIGAYIMKHFRFTAREVIGYMRICRPGMVIGPQQHFLEDIEQLMWQEGDVYRGVGLRSAGAGGGEVESDEVDKEEVGGFGTAVTPSTSSGPISKTTVIASNAVTPRATGGGGVALPPSNISIVTPDGQPFRLLTTPVMGRKLRIDESHSSSSSSSTPERMIMSTISKTSQSSLSRDEGSTALAGKIATSNDDNDEVDEMQEVDQAGALLSRRLDQYQARRQQSTQK
ncbi:hypothetical protein ACHAXA_002190 [Cyclostephanos tholiformis]|uniref:protein-tyrosine-phosphatase n=1 Tax=Cyclostephanos tholiformis TaxID=382380 RepID=A0ABD3RVK3_9STRA